MEIPGPAAPAAPAALAAGAGAPLFAAQGMVSITV